MNEQADALGANAARAWRDGKEDKPGAADDILERDITHCRKHPAVGRIVAVIAYHEEMAGWHGVDVGVVVKAVVDAIERLMTDAVRQGFAPVLHLGGGIGPAQITADEVRQPLALHRGAVDGEQSLLHLNTIAGQSHHALDVIGRSIFRQTKYNDVAARGFEPKMSPENSGGEKGSEK